MNSKKYLTEAFQAMSSLDEELFNLNDKDQVDELSAFVEDDLKSVDSEVFVIDTEANNEDELKDSYIGNVIVQCEVCKSLIYKNPEELEIDEEQELANVEEACPFCNSIGGYKVIGKVAPFEEAKQAADQLEDEVVDGEEEAEEEEAAEEDIKDDLDEAVSIEDRTGTIANVFKKHMDEIGAVAFNFKAFKELLLNLLDSEELTDKEGVAQAKRRIAKAKGPAHLYSIFTGYVTGETVGSSRKDESVKELDESVNEDADAKYAMTLRVDDGYVDESVTYAFKKTRNGGWKWSCDYEGFYDFKPIKSLSKFISREVKNYINPDTCTVDAIKKSFPDADVEDFKDSSVVEVTLTPALADVLGSDGMDQVKKEVSSLTKWWDIRSASLDIQDIPLDLDESVKELDESVNHVSVETDKDVVTVNSDDSGGVTVSTSPKAEEIDQPEEGIAPLADEDKEKIIPDVAVDDEFMVDIDEISEDEFEELGEKYLKRVYSNVESFKLSEGFVKGKSIQLNGTITFTSGSKTNTSFIFEHISQTKTGKIKLTGKNNYLTNSKNAFTVKGTLTEGKKLVCESLTYNYSTKDEESKDLKKLYGTVKTVKK